MTRVDLVGKHWNGPNDTPIIEKLVLPNIPDEQARLIMFENGELDVMTIDIQTYARRSTRATRSIRCCTRRPMAACGSSC